MNIQEVIGAESKFNKGVSISDGELKLLATFYSDMVEYHSGDRLLKAHFRALYNKVIDLIDIRKQTAPAPVKSKKIIKGTFQHLVDFAAQHSIIVERSGTEIEWWHRDKKDGITGVCYSIAEAFMEIEAEVGERAS